MQLLNQRVTGRCRNPTVVVSVSGHVDEALVSPLLAPAAQGQAMVRSVMGFKHSGRETAAFHVHSPVFDDPVSLVFHVLSFESVTHQQHTVVQLLAAAVGLVVDS